MRRQHLLLLVLFPLLALAPHILLFRALATGDGEIPPKIANLQAWARGDSGFWTMSLEGGSLQVGITGNPMWPLDPLFLFLEPHVASNISLVAQVVTAGVAFFLWRCRGRRQPALAALAGGLTYELCHLAMARVGAGHEIATLQYAMVPFALWLMDLLVERRHLRFAVLFPPVFFQMALASSPGQTIPLVLLMGGYLLFAVRRERASLLPSLATWIGAMGLGLAMAAWVYCPGWFFAHHAVAPGSPEFGTPDYRYHVSFPWTGLVQLVAPFFFGDDVSVRSFLPFFAPENTGNFCEYAVYAGLLATATPLLFRREFGRSHEARFWLLIAAVLLLISFGRWGGLYVALSRLPIMEHLRGPARFLIALPVPFAVFASFAVEWMGQRDDAARQRVWRGLAAIAFAAFCLAAAWAVSSRAPLERAFPPGSRARERAACVLGEQVRPAALLNVRQVGLTALASLAALLIVRRFPRHAAAGLLAFHATDLLVNAYPVLPRNGSLYTKYTLGSPFSTVIQARTDPDHSRFMDAAGVTPILMPLLDGTRSTTSYSNLHLRWYQELICAAEGKTGIYHTYDYRHTNAASPVSRLLRARILLARQKPPSGDWTELVRISGVSAFERKDIPPEFYFARAWRVVPSRSERLRLLADSSRDPYAESLLEAPPPRSPQTGAAPRCSGDWKGETSVRVGWQGDAGGLLCTDITWYPLWRARDQDGELEVVRVNHALVGVLTRSGSREVRLWLDPVHHRWGLAITACAAGGWIALLLAAVLRRRFPLPRGTA